MPTYPDYYPEKLFQSARTLAKHMAKKFPKSFQNVAARAEEYMRGMVTGGTLFEELGFSI